MPIDQETLDRIVAGVHKKIASCAITRTDNPGTVIERVLADAGYIVLRLESTPRWDIVHTGLGEGMGQKPEGRYLRVADLTL